MAPIFRIVSVDEPNGIFNNTDAGNFIYVKEGVLVSKSSPLGTTAIELTFGANRLTIHGEVASVTGNGIDLGRYFGTSEGEDIYTASDDNRILIGDSGAVAGQGFNAMLILGSNNRIINRGEITEAGDSAAIFFRAGNGNRIDNEGAIIAAGKAIDFSGTVNTMAVTGNNLVENQGTIEALGTAASPGIAVVGSLAGDTVLNSGHITGAILLGGGNDIYDGALGTLTGTIDLSNGNDTGSAGANDDLLNGGVGDDELKGGAGNDRFLAALNDGSDEIEGGVGSDTYVGTNRHWSVDLDAGTAFDGFHMDFLEEIENFFSGTGNDTLTGTAASNRFIADSGLDTLSGQAGNDRLNGGQSADTLTGGAGRDILVGGGAVDVFNFDAISESPIVGHDVIRDFVAAAGVNDKVDLATIDANTAAGGNQAFILLTTVGSSFTGVAGQLRYYQAGGSTYIEGDVDGNAVADLQIQLIGLYNSLTAACFNL